MHLQFKENWVKVVSNDPVEIRAFGDAIQECIPNQVGSHIAINFEAATDADSSALALDVEQGDWDNVANVFDAMEAFELRDELQEAFNAFEQRKRETAES